MLRTFTFLTLVCLLLISARIAHAQVQFTADENAFNAANPGLFFQDFQDGDVTPPSTQECGSIINRSTNDACFSPGDILPGIEFETEFGFELLGSANGDTNVDVNVLCVDPGIVAGPFIVNLERPFPAVGLTLGCIADGGCDEFTMNVEVLSDNNVIGGTTVDVSDFFNTFLGITSSVPIDSIVLDIPLPPDGIVECVQDVRFGGDVIRPIPTLSEWGLIAMAGVLGLVGFMVIRRRVTA